MPKQNFSESASSLSEAAATTISYDDVIGHPDSSDMFICTAYSPDVSTAITDRFSQGVTAIGDSSRTGAVNFVGLLDVLDLDKSGSLNRSEIEAVPLNDSLTEVEQQMAKILKERYDMIRLLGFGIPIPGLNEDISLGDLARVDEIGLSGPEFRDAYLTAFNVRQDFSPKVWLATIGLTAAALITKNPLLLASSRGASMGYSAISTFVGFQKSISENDEREALSNEVSEIQKHI